MMRLNRSIVLFILCFFYTYPCLAEEAPVSDPAGKAISMPTDTMPDKNQKYTVTFKQINDMNSIPLRGSNTNATLHFGVPRDKLITYAKVKFIYSYSPSFIENLSHVKLYLNDEFLSLLPVNHADSGHSVTQEVNIDPSLFTDHNQLRMQLIGHYKTDRKCEDSLHSSLWVDISGKSSIEFGVQPLAIVDELGLFPEPFFDTRSTTKLILPFVFAENPSVEAIEAAGIISSWFGTRVGWRGARFPVSINASPKKHAIVLATNEQRPDFLKDYPQVDGPQIAIMSLPDTTSDNIDGVNPFIKILLVLGRNESELKSAAQALTLGQAILAGNSVTIDNVQIGPVRTPYDSPNWVRLDRPTKFIELVTSPTDLQASGHTPRTIQIGLRIPADLFIWRSRGVPVDVKYRYTPLVEEGESRLNISVNHQFVEAFNLRTSGKNGIKKQLDLPLLTDTFFGSGSEYYLPAFKLGSDNQMQFDFSFSRQVNDPCASDPVDNVKAAIDGDSTLDFSDFPHYVALPNLAFFVNSGYPFTVQADLAETAVLMSQNPDKYELETYLTLLGRMGISTGYPATRIQVLSDNNYDSIGGKNILIIGRKAHTKATDHWKLKLPVDMADSGSTMSLPARNPNFLVDWFGFETDPDTTPASGITVNGQGPHATLIGFESPNKQGRSVVSVLGAKNSDLIKVLNTLDDSGKVAHIHGSVAQIRASSIESYLVGETYTVGHLPLNIKVWFFLSKYPLLLTILTVLSVFVVAILIWRALRLIMSRRIVDEGVE